MQRILANRVKNTREKSKSSLRSHSYISPSAQVPEWYTTLVSFDPNTIPNISQRNELRAAIISAVAYQKRTAGVYEIKGLPNLPLLIKNANRYLRQHEQVEPAAQNYTEAHSKSPYSASAQISPKGSQISIAYAEAGAGSETSPMRCSQVSNLERKDIQKEGAPSSQLSFISQAYNRNDSLKLRMPHSEESKIARVVSPTISDDQLLSVNKNYVAYKNGLFGLRWLDQSRETQDIMFNLTKLRDPQRRFQIALDYVIKNPGRAYAKELINISSELRKAANAAKTNEPKSSSFWVWRGMGF